MQVVGALAGNPAAQDAVRLLRFYDIDAPSSRLPATGKVVVKQHLTDVQIRLLPGTEDVPDWLEVQCRLDATLRYVEDGVSYDIKAVKPLTYRLEPAPAGRGAELAHRRVRRLAHVRGGALIPYGGWSCQALRLTSSGGVADHAGRGRSPRRLSR